MTEKHKHDVLAERNELVDRVGIRVAIDLHSTLPIDVCGDRLKEIGYGMTFFKGQSQIVTVTPVHVNALSVNVQRKMRARSVNLITSQADFSLRDDGAGGTVVEGDAWMSYWYLGYMVFIMVIILVIQLVFLGLIAEAGYFPMLFIPVTMVVLGFYFWRSLSDRNAIMRDIEEAVSGSTAKSKH